MPGRPKKARRRRKYEPKKSKTKLSRHGRDMHCGNCDSDTHNSKTCSLYDGASTSHDASVPRNGTGCKRKNQQRQLLESASASRNGTGCKCTKTWKLELCITLFELSKNYLLLI
nr:zinc finger protein CONSTANS-LIKE 14-like [Tanacetum cinerariifolium]